MKTLINYSHKLIDFTHGQIEDAVGEAVNEIVVPVQLDFDQPIRPQLEALVDQAPGTFDLYIPPALSFAAAYVSVALAQSVSGDRPRAPRMVVLKREGVPPRFVLAEVIP